MLKEGQELEILKREFLSVPKEMNQGRYLKRYAVSKGICYISVEVEGCHPMGSFEVREEDWDDLKTALSDAGYGIR